MNNGRFAISVHILTLLTFAEDEWTSSEYLAGSININPVLVRKELANLRSRGLVASKEGKAGGSKLAKAPELIYMSDVYEAVRQKDLLGKATNLPNPDCKIGREINDHMDFLYDQAERTLIDSLKQVSLKEFCNRFV